MPVPRNWPYQNKFKLIQQNLIQFYHSEFYQRNWSRRLGGATVGLTDTNEGTSNLRVKRRWLHYQQGPPPSVSSIAHIHKIQNTFFLSALFSSVTRSRSFLEITAWRDLPQNAMNDPDDPAISRFCEAQTFVTVHTTARHYLLSNQSTSCLCISRSQNSISSLLHLLLSNCLFRVFNFSDHNMLVRSMHVGHYVVNYSKFLLTLSWAPQASRDVPGDAGRGRRGDKRNTMHEGL